MINFILGLKKAVSWILVIISLVSSIFIGKPADTAENMELLSEYSYTLDKGMSFAQGIATDGKYFYGFGAVKPVRYNAITKIDAKTGKIVAMNEMCIPRYLMNEGYCHLGDGCYYEGKLYIACEDKNFEKPAVMIYDAETLKFIESKVIPAEHIGTGNLPWCTVSGGILYYSMFCWVDEIMMLDISDNFSYCGSVKMDKSIDYVQGGDIVDGVLYLSTDDGEKEKLTYAIDLETGGTEIFCERDTGSKITESEGMTACLFDDGSMFHYVDAGLSIKIRNYRVDL